jgi:hypothetical protein
MKLLGRGWVGAVSLGNGKRKEVSGKTRKEVTAARWLMPSSRLIRSPVRMPHRHAPHRATLP